MKITGVIREDSVQIPTTKLAKCSLKVGIYGTKDGRVLSSTITLWVPVPTDLRHQPGIFLRLHNAAGSSYTRITPDDLSSISTFLDSFRNTIESSYYQAVAYHDALKEHHRKAFESIDSSLDFGPSFPTPDHTEDSEILQLEGC